MFCRLVAHILFQICHICHSLLWSHKNQSQHISTNYMLYKYASKTSLFEASEKPCVQGSFSKFCKWLRNLLGKHTIQVSLLSKKKKKKKKKHAIRYCEKVYERSGKNLFWSIKNSGDVLNKLKSRGFRATSLSTYDFSTLYTTLPHNLIKEKLINLIEWTFKRESSPYIACNERQAFFTSGDTKRYKLWSCQNVCEALIYIFG